VGFTIARGLAGVATSCTGATGATGTNTRAGMMRLKTGTLRTASPSVPRSPSRIGVYVCLSYSGLRVCGCGSGICGTHSKARNATTPTVTAEPVTRRPRTR